MADRIPSCKAAVDSGGSLSGRANGMVRDNDAALAHHKASSSVLGQIIGRFTLSLVDPRVVRSR